jgi:hypothetical protein
MLHGNVQESGRFENCDLRSKGPRVAVRGSRAVSLWLMVRSDMLVGKARKICPAMLQRRR